MMQLCCLLARPEVSLVVNVHAIGDRIEAALGAQLLHDAEQFIFALKTTLAIIPHVVRAVQLGRLDDLDRESLLVGEGNRIREMRACEAGGIRNYGQHVFSQGTMRRPSQVRGVNPARVSDKQSAKVTQC
jgi:hypothetical protein